MKPSTIYGCTKIYNELLGNYYRISHDLDFRSIRYPQVISPTEPFGGSGDFAVSIFYEILRSKKYTSYLNLESRIPMIFIDDLI